MAEFQDVMRQLNRLCSHYQHCSACLMFDECGNIGAHGSDPKHSYRIEKRVMAWAAEHPEPVYPTWEQAIAEIYLRSGRTKYRNIAEWEINERVPADIAQKLGIDPKVGGDT